VREFVYEPPWSYATIARNTLTSTLKKQAKVHYGGLSSFFRQDLQDLQDLGRVGENSWSWRMEWLKTPFSNSNSKLELI
jgi:hypothetical protein